MTIDLKCPCGKRLRARDELVGKRIRCPGCGQTVRVSAEEDASVEVAAPDSPGLDGNADVPSDSAPLLPRDFEDVGSAAEILLCPRHQDESELAPVNGRILVSEIARKPRRDRFLVLTGGIDPTVQNPVLFVKVGRGGEPNGELPQTPGTLLFTDVGILFVKAAQAPSDDVAAKASFGGQAFLPADELGPFRATALGVETSFRGIERLMFTSPTWPQQDFIVEAAVIADLERWRTKAAKKRAALGDAGPPSPGLAALAEWAFRPPGPLPKWVTRKIAALNHGYEEDLVAVDAPILVYYPLFQIVAARLARESDDAAQKLSKRLAKLAGDADSAAFTKIALVATIVVCVFAALMGSLYLLVELTSRR